MGSTDAYYIVMEYGGNITLKQFIDRGKLNIKHWQKICKYIMWQIAAALNWMHDDMNCAHLDLTLENIVMNDDYFLLNSETGTVSVDRNLTIKLVDFGLSEIFRFDPCCDDKRYFQYDVDDKVLGPFHINNKFGSMSPYQSPQTFREEVYDGRKADIWSLGVILFYVSFGTYPYQRQQSGDTGFWACKHRQISLFLDMAHLSHLSNPKLLALLSGCLRVEEAERFDIGRVITDSYFKTYYNHYADKIRQKSREQLVKIINDRRSMDITIPYYKAS